MTIGYRRALNGITARADAFHSIVAGRSFEGHSLAVRSDGTVAAWGWNGYGQLNLPAGLTGVVSLATGNGHALALKEDGTVAGWGANSFGESKVPAGLVNVIAVSAGGTHSLALKDDGTVVAWGDSRYGLANIPADLDRRRRDHCRPVSQSCAQERRHRHGVGCGSDRNERVAQYGQSRVPASLGNVIAIAASEYNSFALKSDGAVVAWGNNSFGQASVPVGLTDVVAISAGLTHALALKRDGTVVAWGDNRYGQRTIPDGLTNVIAIAAGGWHNLALKSDGTVVAWGNNVNGQANVPTSLTAALPPTVTISGAVDVTTAGTYTLTYTATDQFGRVTSITRTVVVETPSGLALNLNVALNGANSTSLTTGGSYIDPGVSATYTRAGGTAAVSVRELKSIAAGRYYESSNSLAIRSDGTLAVWGSNSFRQNNVPAGLSNLLAVVAGGLNSLVLKTDGTVQAWGSNGHGESTVPAGLSSVMAIAAGGGHAMALKRDGTVTVWGDNRFGLANVPSGLAHVVAISAGFFHRLALKDDGTVVAWGAGSTPTNDVPAPLDESEPPPSLVDNPDFGQSVVPAGLTDVVAIAAGEYHSMALKRDGTVVAWGYNASGAATVPVGLSNVVAISAGWFHSLALRRDGTVVAWGVGAANLGTGISYGQSMVPAGLNDVVAIAAGGWHNLALRADGTVIAWGDNRFGQATVPDALVAALPPVTTINGSVNVNQAGTYPISYETMDRFGSSATVTRTVIVTNPPVPPLALHLALEGGDPLAWPQGTAFVDPGVAVTYTRAGGSVAVDAGEFHALAAGRTYDGHSVLLKSDGTVAVWGANGFQQNRVPAGLTDVVSVSAGYGHSLALKRDGTVVAWGGNGFGESSVPAGLIEVISVAAGGSHSMALKKRWDGGGLGRHALWPGQCAAGLERRGGDCRGLVPQPCLEGRRDGGGVGQRHQRQRGVS